MTWSTPITWTAGLVVSAADMNAQIRDNMNYLLSGRPGGGIQRDNNADYSTTSTSFVAVDSTNLKITATWSGSKALIAFSGVVNPGVMDTAFSAWDCDIDGTRVGAAGTEGLTKQQGGGGAIGPVGFTVIKTGLSAASHTFTLYWKCIAAGTARLAGGSGTAGQDFIPSFSVAEIG